jgi:hypothetical protein
MQQFMAQLQQMFAAPGSGPVNWDLARQVAARNDDIQLCSISWRYQPKLPPLRF